MKFELVSFCVVSFLASAGASTRISHDTSSHGVRSHPAEEPASSESYFPWTHEPVCTDHLNEMDSQLCVYTNATFSNGRGISIFTTPRIAKEFAALSPFQDAEALTSNGINPKPNIKKQPWYTKIVPGKGTGMYASRKLERGDPITAYTPYFIMHAENILTPLQREEFLRFAIDQLPQASKEAYLNLAKIYNEPSVVVQDVVKANAFEIEVGGTMHLAVFPESSRYNHACAPNAQYFLSGDLLTHYVHAVRPITKDEELTISYAPPLRLHADRQHYLSSTFQFTCTCSRCSPTTHGRTIEDSDQATQDIIALQWALGQWTSNSTASVKKAEMLVRLYKQEGLDAFLDDAYGHAALTYSAVGSPRGATKYAKLAAEATWLKFGFDSVGMGKVNEWKSIAEDPTAHGTWKSRKTEL